MVGGQFRDEGLLRFIQGFVRFQGVAIEADRSLRTMRATIRATTRASRKDRFRMHAVLAQPPSERSCHGGQS